MEAFLKRFLAKNKYPEVVHRLESLEAEFENLPMEETSSDSNASLILTLQNLGLGAAENLDKAEQWARQLTPELANLSLLILVYLRSSPMGYSAFHQDYQRLIESAQDVEADDHEYLYRFLRLLSGWCQFHQEAELGQDLWQLSEWVEQPNLEPLLTDQLINKWLAQSRQKDLILIRWVIGDHEKLDYLLNRDQPEDDE